MEASSRKAKAMNSSTDRGVAGLIIVLEKLCCAVEMMPAGRQDAAAGVVKALAAGRCETVGRLDYGWAVVSSGGGVD